MREKFETLAGHVRKVFGLLFKDQPKIEVRQDGDEWCLDVGGFSALVEEKERLSLKGIVKAPWWVITEFRPVYGGPDQPPGGDVVDLAEFERDDQCVTELVRLHAASYAEAYFIAIAEDQMYQEFLRDEQLAQQCQAQENAHRQQQRQGYTTYQLTLANMVALWVNAPNEQALNTFLANHPDITLRQPPVAVVTKDAYDGVNYVLHADGSVMMEDT